MTKLSKIPILRQQSSEKFDLNVSGTLFSGQPSSHASRIQQKREHQNADALFFGGSNQIRTGVNGFADRYLTTRTWNPVCRNPSPNCAAKLVLFSRLCKFFSQYFLFFTSREHQQPDIKLITQKRVRLIIPAPSSVISLTACRHSPFLR